ncbi:hypothetical protein C0J52_26888, partial [Blattella germanica]
SLGNIWWVYINYAQETFSFQFFRDLELSIILIGMVKNVSVFELIGYSYQNYYINKIKSYCNNKTRFL